MNLAIQTSELVKSYSGRAVLDKLTFRVPRGSICGFLGANGAGKTTTLRILMGFARADEGTAEVLGTPAGSTHEIFRKVAFVAEVKEAYAFARVGEMIRLTRGFYPQWDTALEARLLRDFELPVNQWCTKLSKGTRAKLLLLLALCRRPELLVLDEPTEGLDPIATEYVMRLLIEQVANNGATVFFSTHQLSEVEQIADRVVMIRRGACVLEGALDDIRQRHQRVRCVLPDDARLPFGLSHWKREGRFVTGFSSDDPADLAEQFDACGIKLLEAQPATLKELFLEEVGK